ncbi:MAG: HAD-IA family hydrolase [Chloroflexota bacterium]|nr:HAD-IA family hydrolase [Chloroflexota bacterium]MDE2946378.1 HAD-IA family hydrolase [Chloroflexota bacterium]
MIKAVLLDLDNTLLHNPDRLWAAAFREQWDRCFAERYAIDGASAALRGAIHRLNGERAAYRTNAAAMLDALSLELPLARDDLSAALAGFYKGAYLCLRALTSPVAEAVELVESLLNQNLLVAIATNPLYPAAAIEERIAWAGLADYLSDFAFITHSENMHFAKPSPAYFAETVARVGVEPDEALVLGDSVVNDIAPAEAIGLHAWRVDSDNVLGGVIDHVRQLNWREAYHSRQLQYSMILPQYSGNIAALYGLLAEVKPHQWHQQPDPNEWSIMQILCHLWQSETSVHFQRLKTILAQDDPFIAAPAPPGPHIPPCHDDGYHVMRCFHDAREDTIQLLSRLAPHQWQRPARHSIFGLTNFLEMAHFTAQHDRLHITQLCQTLGKCAD